MLLKRSLSIFNDLIFESRVVGGMPSLAAAPAAPDTRPLASASAASIKDFWSFASRWLSAGLGGRGGGAWLESQLSSMENVPVSQRITDRSMTFCNSRMLPGHGYDRSSSSVFFSMPDI